MEKYDAIVIGSGIGGLAAALLLQNEGKKTLVLEKLDGPGGRLSSRVRDGFKLDLGVHVISRGNNGPIGQVLEMTGCGQPLNFINVRPVTNYKGEIFKFPHDLAKYVPEEDFDGLMKFMGYIRSLDDEASHQYDGISLTELLNKFTENPMVHTSVSTIDAVYLGIHAYMSSAGEFIRCLNWEATARSSGYPEGGCISITNEYLKGFKKKGGEIKFGCPVEKIIVEDGKAIGVVADGTTYTADYIVSNADIQNTVVNLVGEEYFDADYVEYAKGLVYANTSLIIRIALDKKLTDLKMFSRMSDQPIQEVYEKMRKNEFEGGGMFFVVPSNFSEGICDPDKQLFMVASVFPSDVPDSIHEKIKEFFLDTLADMFPGFRESILWIDETRASELKESLGEEGATIGIAQSPGQSGVDRPKIKSPIENLYFVGGEAGGSGVGTELCVNSALEFYENYVK